MQDRCHIEGTNAESTLGSVSKKKKCVKRRHGAFHEELAFFLQEDTNSKRVQATDRINRPNRISLDTYLKNLNGRLLVMEERPQNRIGKARVVQVDDLLRERRGEREGETKRDGEEVERKGGKEKEESGGKR